MDVAFVKEIWAGLVGVIKMLKGLRRLGIEELTFRVQEKIERYVNDLRKQPGGGKVIELDCLIQWGIIEKDEAKYFPKALKALEEQGIVEQKGGTWYPAGRGPKI